MLAELRARRRNRLIADAAWKLARAADLHPNPADRTVTPQQVIQHVWIEHLIRITEAEAAPHIAAALAHWQPASHKAA